jgi:hypothetical protein
MPRNADLELNEMFLAAGRTAEEKESAEGVAPQVVAPPGPQPQTMADDSTCKLIGEAVSAIWREDQPRRSPLTSYMFHCSVMALNTTVGSVLLAQGCLAPLLSAAFTPPSILCGLPLTLGSAAHYPITCGFFCVDVQRRVRAMREAMREENLLMGVRAELPRELRQHISGFVPEPSNSR